MIFDGFYVMRSVELVLGMFHLTKIVDKTYTNAKIN